MMVGNFPSESTESSSHRNIPLYDLLKDAALSLAKFSSPETKRKRAVEVLHTLQAMKTTQIPAIIAW